MKVLFVASGNKNGAPGAVVKNQADSLSSKDIELSFFLIKGKGIVGYLKNIIPLVKFLKKNDFVVVHSHYSLSAFVTTIALWFVKPVPHVVSLMGSDTQLKGISRKIVKICHSFFWSKTIVKSEQMLTDSGLKNAEIIPNGVDLKKISNIENNLENEFSVNKQKKIVLFAANPVRESKNYSLAEQAMKNIPAELKVVYNKPHEEILAEILHADVLLLTSRWEGSPNIIKEAMGCNCPIVSTNVGDVTWLLGETPGHFITNFDPVNVSNSIDLALKFKSKCRETAGRQRIINLGLDADSVANRIYIIYKTLIENAQ